MRWRPARPAACRSRRCSPGALPRRARRGAPARPSCAGSSPAGRPASSAEQHRHRQRRDGPEPDGQRRLRGARDPARERVRRLAFGQHDRRDPVARPRQGPRLRGVRLDRLGGRSQPRRDLRGDPRRPGDRGLRAVPRDDHPRRRHPALRGRRGGARQAVIAYKLAGRRRSGAVAIPYRRHRGRGRDCRRLPARLRHRPVETLEA